uniref:ZP domain-containing protein n=1 Tax=Romanomermis culicivorax TaxID=13658 RepID=A0A915LBE4_ROMCU
MTESGFLRGALFASVIVYFGISLVAAKDAFNDDPNTFNFVEAAKVVDKKATCDDKFIYFNLVFNQPFRGLIYSEGSFRVDKCVYANGTHRPSTRYNVSIPLDDCNSKKFGNGTSQNVLIVQQDPKIMEVDDNFYFITCQILDPISSLSPLLSPADHFRRIGSNVNKSTFGGGFGLSSDDFPDNERRITLSFLGLTVQNDAPSTEIVTNVAPISLDYSAEVQLGSGAPNSPPVDRVLRVGEPLSYVVRLRNLRNLDARVGRCWATDRQGSDIQLSDDDGCSLQTGILTFTTMKHAKLYKN